MKHIFTNSNESAVVRNGYRCAKVARPLRTVFLIGTLLLTLGVGQMWADPWVKLDVSTGSQGTKTVGDAISGSDWWFNYQTNGGWSTGTDIQVLIGTSTSAYSTVDASWYADDGDNKKVHANIKSFTFDKSGKWYAVGKYKSGSTTAYTSGTSWTNNTSLSTSMSTSNSPYWTVNPPSVKSFAVSTEGSDIIGGEGTEDNPYLITNNGSLVLTLSGSKNKTDANSSLQYNTAGTWNTTTSRTISSITNIDATSVTVKMRCYNSTASLSGTESSKTIYYKVKAQGFESSLNGIKYVTTGDPVEWSFNGQSAQTRDLNTVTNLYLKEWFTYEYQNWDGSDGNTKFQYNIHRTAVAAGAYTDIANNWSWNDSWSSGWQHLKYGHNSQNVNLLSGLGSGKYTMSFRYNDPDLDITSPVHSLKWTIGVPSMATHTVTSDGTGSGTDGSPFNMAVGNTLTITVSGTQSSSDANSVLYVSFDNGANYSATTTHSISIANTTKSSVHIKAKYYNSADNLSGTVYDFGNVYYQGTLTPSLAISSFTQDASTVTAANSGTTVTINASRQNAGTETITYAYSTDNSNWTTIASTTNTSQSWTLPAVTSTTTYYVKASMTYDSSPYSDTETFTVYGKKTIKVKNTNNWASMLMHRWGGTISPSEWPGESTQISAYGTGQWKQVVLYSSNANFVLVDGSNSDNHTADQTFAGVSDGTCYKIQSGTGGSLTLTGETCPETPSVTTGSVSVKNLTSLTFTATGVADNRDAITTYGFKYGTTSACADGDVSATNLSSGSFSKQVTGLSVGTKYYYKAYATNGQGTTYGSVQNATTTLATLSLAGTANYVDKTMTITPTTNMTAGNGFSGTYYRCITCTTKPGGAADPTMTWNGSTSKFDISGTVAGTYTFKVQLRSADNCGGTVFNNAEKTINITMKDFVDLSSLTINHAVNNGTYMNGNGASATPYFIYVSNATSYGKLNLSATLAAVLAEGSIYYSVDGSEIGAVTVAGTAASVTMDLPNKTVGAGRTAVIKFYHKLDGQDAPNAKQGSVTVYYTVNTDPVVTVSATYNGNPLVGSIPQNADITLSASVTQIPGEPTFTYSKGAGAYTTETTYTIEAAGTTTMHAKTTYLGDWIGNLDITTYAANSVTLTTLKTDMYGDDSSSSTSRLFSNAGEEYTAPDIEGYTFSDWSCSNDNVRVSDDSGANWKGTSTNQTVYVKAITTGGTLTAHYTENKRIYFDNRNAKWEGDIYVYLFNGDSWYNEYNGSNQNGPGVVPRINLIEDGIMTQIGESDVYYYEYSTASAFTRVAFSVGNQHNYKHLYATNGVWRTDFKTCNPCYVAPETSDQIKYDHGDNKPTYYYNNGYWRRYMPSKSALSLWMKVGAEIRTYDFVPEIPGVDGENFKAEVLRAASTTYEFNLPSSCGGAYGNNGTMNKDNHSNWTFEPTSGSIGNCHITTTAEGTYIFHLNTVNGQVKLSVDYPLSEGDYRIYYSDITGKNNNYSDYLRKNSGSTEKNDTVSFFVKQSESASPTYLVQRCSGFTGTTPNWDDVGTAQSISVAKDSVYIFVFQQPSGGASISKIAQDYYSGQYYVRTDAAGGGWANYKTNPDNIMKHTDKPSALAAGYNYYYLQWIGDASGNSTANVKYVVANDYNSCVSQEFGNDPAGGSLSGGQALTGKGANVRFTYNTMTNEMTRTYIGGSGHDPSYLVLNGTNLKTIGGAAWTGRTALEDQNDWIYTLNLKAADDATVTLESHYNNKFVTLLSSEKILDVSDAEYYDLRVIYDYKTNQIVAAYIPSTAVNTELEVDVDIMFIRKAKDNHEVAPPTTLSLGVGGSITGAAKTLYGAIEFEKDYVRAEGSYSGLSSNRPIRSTYWISFPFDVRIKDIFGLGDYTETWIIQQYRGDLRAEKGWFLDTKTFWEYIMDENFVLQAGQGYVLSIDCEAIQWPNNRTTQYLYFPSQTTVTEIASVIPNASTTVTAHPCTITSPADRTNKDSNWNVIGIPAFTTGWGQATETVNTYYGDFKYFYNWNATGNTLVAANAHKFNFQYMHSYMVQYAGTINWTISEPAMPARRAATAMPEEVEFRLDLLKGDIEQDHTFVTFMDNEKISTNFDMNSDLVKMLNAKSSNIYTIINNDVQVAANCLPMTEMTTIVPVGINILSSGEYTFAMPEGTNGIGVTLVDNETGDRTNLALGDYTITLEKGTFDERFVLEISPVAQTPTGMEEVTGDGLQVTGARKVMVDGVLYIVKDGKVFDARGARIQ